MPKYFLLKIRSNFVSFNLIWQQKERYANEQKQKELKDTELAMLNERFQRRSADSDCYSLSFPISRRSSTSSYGVSCFLFNLQ